jgi:hypothetical protein
MRGSRNRSVRIEGASPAEDVLLKEMWGGAREKEK